MPPQTINEDDLGLRILIDRERAQEDVLAIHGRGAHPRKTWCQRRCQNKVADSTDDYIDWLSDDTMLPAVLPTARIMGYGYRSNWFGKDALVTSPREIVAELLEVLLKRRESCAQRPLIILAHSFGGVLVMEMLVTARTRHSELYNSITGLVFFGTPFRGNGQYPRATLIELAYHVQEQADGTGKRVYAEQLQTSAAGNAYLESTFNKFKQGLRDHIKPRIACFYEQQESDIAMIISKGETARSVLWVNEHSSTLDNTDVAFESHGRACNHLGLNKYTHASSPDFQVLARVVKRMADESSSLITKRHTRQGAFALNLDLSQVVEVQHFVGREAELQAIRSALPPGAGRRIMVLQGLGGLGKTQLAIAYAKRYRADYSAILWLRARDKDSLSSSFLSIAKRLLAQYPAIPGLANLVEAGTAEDIIECVNTWLSQTANTRWLLIYDNHDNPKTPENHDKEALDLQQYLPGASQGAILITSRSTEVGLGRLYQIKTMNARNGLEILEDTSGRSNLSTDADALKLIKKLDGLPLAIATAGAYLTQVTDTFAEYLTRFESSWAKLQHLSPRLMTYENRALYTTWDVTYKQVQERNELSAQILKLWAYFDNQDLWFELLCHREDRFPSWLLQLTEDKLYFTACMRVLCNHGLVQVSERTTFGVDSVGYSVHACVHSWMNTVLNATHDVELADTALWCIAVHLPLPARDHSLLARRMIAHADRCARDGPDHAGVVWNRCAWLVLAELFEEMARYPEAERLLEQVLAVDQKELGADHTSTLYTLNALGILYWKQQRLMEAEAMFVRVLVGTANVLGIDHLSNLDNVENLGLVYLDQGKLAEAEAMFIRVLAVKAILPGADHSESLDILSNLGIVYEGQDKLVEAEAMYERALTGKEKLVGPDHKSTLAVVHNIACLYTKQGRLTEAEAMYERALSGRHKTLGAEHEETLVTVSCLAELYCLQGRLDMAEQMYDRAMNRYPRRGRRAQACREELDALLEQLRRSTNPA